MYILDKILQAKKEELKLIKEIYPPKLLERSKYFQTKTVSLVKYLNRKDKFGIIAEIKRKSPSKGLINRSVNVESLSIGYMQAGASGLSVLTDKEFFGGSLEDLETARKYNFCPILRKDFIIDEYQIIEAKSFGADVILLIAQALDTADLKRLAKFAKSLGLETILEVHQKDEIEKNLNEDISIVGVNNRDLRTFTVDVNRSYELAEIIPKNFTKISESGLSDISVIKQLKSVGYKGFLMGEHFMRYAEPDKACKQLIDSLRQ